MSHSPHLRRTHKQILAKLRLLSAALLTVNRNNISIFRCGNDGHRKQSEQSPGLPILPAHGDELLDRDRIITILLNETPPKNLVIN
jgi:hypothetical protein